jgi:predicted nucleic acid-binding protein
VILYLDTSSVLTVYLDEPTSDHVTKLQESARYVATSLITYPEARSGLARAVRGGRLSREGYKAALAEFEAAWPWYGIQDVSRPLAQLAGELAAKHFLRGFDGVHLASAVVLQRELGEAVTFSSGDGRLMGAAAIEGLSMPPGIP